MLRFSSLPDDRRPRLSQRHPPGGGGLKRVEAAPACHSHRHQGGRSKLSDAVLPSFLHDPTDRYGADDRSLNLRSDSLRGGEVPSSVRAAPPEGMSWHTPRSAIAASTTTAVAGLLA